MRKQVRRYFRKSLCGMLSAAMIVTSLIVPNMTVYAAPRDEAGMTTENEEDKPVEEITGEKEAGDENKDSGLEEPGVGDKENADDEDGSSETGGNADEADEENPKDGDGVKEDEEAAENEAEPKEVPEAVMAASAADARSSDAIQFYFYYEPEKGEADGVELAVGVWSNDKNVASITPSPSETSWDGDYYLMESVEGYSNWYKIGLTISDEVTESVEDGKTETASTAGFHIYKKVNGQNPADVASFDGWNYTEIYKELLGENLKSYAVKNEKGYANDGKTDLATAIMRQVTLYVYDAVDTPYLQVGDAIEKTLSKVGVDEETGKMSLIPLEESKTVDEGNGYAFQVDTGHENWYSITFSAPGKFEFDGTEKICNLYSGDQSSGWVAGFMNGEPSQTWNTDFTPVFAGKVYYKDKAFSDEREDETQAEGDITFYYYLGDATDDEKVGLYCKDDGKVTVPATANAATEEWAIDTNATVYLLKKVEGYKGWYSIPIHVEDEDKESGFAIYVKSASGTPALKVKYDKDNNADTYEQIVSGKNKTCAYKESISYIGTDETTKVDKVAAIMRNVTVNIYSEDVIPVIQRKKDLTPAKLYVVDERNGEISEINLLGQDGSGNNIYGMEQLDNSYWYTLSFSAPGGISPKKDEEIGELYDKTTGYDWLRNLINGEANNYGENFTPVFDGNIWVKYEHNATDTARKLTFHATRQEVELALLDELLKSEEVANIVAKGEAGGYTADSWTDFTSAMSAAQEVVDKSKAGTLGPDESTWKPYEMLKDAIDALVSLDTDVTFYYYAGETEDEIGLYYWDNSEEKSNISSTNEKATWDVWGEGDTYLMTKVEGYAGWYSIPINFKNSGADAGFQVYTKTKAGSTTDDYEYKCDAGDDGHKDVYEKLVSGNYDTCAVKNGTAYAHAARDKNSNIVTAIMRQVTLHVYDNKNTPYLQVGDAVEKTLSKVDVDEAGNVSLIPLEPKTVDGGNGYELQADTEYENWYSITFSAPGKFEFDSAQKICNLYSGDQDGWVIGFMNGSPTEEWNTDFTPVFAGKTYYKDRTFYATLDEADPNAKLSLLDKLRMLVDEFKEYKEEDYKPTGWKEFKDALAAAMVVVQKADDAESDETGTTVAPTDDEIKNAYDDLVAAEGKLIPASIVKADIKVDKVPLDDDFITGADLSSYISLKESGVEFKDEEGKPLSDEGFFKYLYDGGTNWVRIRVWNDPYNSSGKGYGGGNNDLEKAKTIGKLATDAGMRVLIDFHYSDFWADPAKQDAPKAWKAYSVDEKVTAVHDYTLSSLQSLKAAGVDVGMVQVGNETNNGICGEKSTENMIKIFNAGSKAVEEFDENCLVAIHFTNPEKGNYAAVADKFATVDYDVFATSYYPFWHGTTGNLTEQLGYVAAKGKKVMVAETSWVTTWDDGDGHENTAPRLTQDLNYDISLQGQADEIWDVVAAAAAVGGNSIGVFYWEPAWISPYYVYDEDGNRIESLYKQNQELWEKYGSGWASSYSAEYDPGDAGKWYGGSAIDNQSWFDFDGTALATAKIYSLIRTGAEAELAITSVESNLTRDVVVGENFTYPQVKATYNDGTLKEPHTELLDVTWDVDEQKLVNLNKMGEYVVHGTVSDGKKDYKVTLTIKVIRKAENNVLVNPGFEDDGNDAANKHTGWDIDPASGSAVNENVEKWKDNPRSGTYAMNFWFEKANTFTVSQTVTPEAGTYSFGGYIQGDAADVEDVQYIFAEVYGKDGTLKSRKKASFTLNGWRNWSEPEITGITVSDGDSIKVGAEILSTVDGAWGSLDDFYLYGMHSVTAEQSEGGTVATSVLKANSGEKVNIAVTPDSGYYLKSLAVSGASITGDNIGEIFTSDNGEVAFQAASGEVANAAVLTYPAETTDSKGESFTMPNGNVTVFATFVSVFDESAQKISLDANTDGKYLVQVNGFDVERPIEDQYYTGKNITPEVELTYKGYKLTSADYTIKYADNKNKTTDAKVTLTAKGERFTGTRTILFNIIDDPRTKEFKDLKVTFKNPDKGDGSTPAKSTYYLGKQKELTPEIVLTESDGTEITNLKDKPVYKVFYQNNKKIGKATVVVLPTDEGLKTYKEGSVTTTFTIAKCPVNYGKVDVSIAQPNQYYTGKKVEPAVTVKLTYTDSKDGTTKTTTLTKGTDYTVAYGNNTNATQYSRYKKDAEGNLEKDSNGNPILEYVNIPNKTATIKITGKGNFTGTRTTYDLKDESKAGTEKITFAIRPRSIENVTITAADLAASTSGAAPKLTVKDGTKTVASSQYLITKIVKKKAADESEDTTVYTYTQTDEGKKEASTGNTKLKEAGTYEVTVAGKNRGNYTGEKTVQFEVKGKEYLISNAKITISGKFCFTGDKIELNTDGETPELKVVAGSGKDAKTLTKEKDYTVKYENNINAGKATVTITGKGEYVGKKTATFTISKRALATGFKAGNEDKEKLTKGLIQTPVLSKKNIETKLDGTWTVDTNGNLINKDNESESEKGTLSIPYTGYTLNPEFTFSAVNYIYIGVDKEEGKEEVKYETFLHELSSNDYTVTYSVGKWVEEKDENGIVIAKTAPVTATVKGKGNYSGSVKIQNMFTLTARKLEDLNIEIDPISYDGGKALKPAVIFSKMDGTVVDLKLGTAYTVTYKNNKLARLFGLNDDKDPNVTVKVKGNGWIIDKTTKDTETASKSRDLFFNIDQQEIVEANVADIAIQTYKGKALTPAVTIKVNGKKLKAGTDYTVTYSNNIKRSGSTIGEVTIVGKGNYFTRNPIEKTFVIK